MEKKKHILVHVTASLSLGGAETVLFNLVCGLQPWYSQRVISFRDGVFREQLEQRGVSVYVITGNIFTRIVRTWRLLNRLNPRVIHALLWSACAMVRVYSRVGGTPSVCALHSPFNANSGDSTARALYDRLTASWATATVCVSYAVLYQSALMPYVPTNKRVLIANGIACDEIFARALRTQKTRATYGLCSDDFVIGTVGRLVPVKNQKILIDLVARLCTQHPQIRLIIVGEGPLRAALEQQVRLYGLESYVRIVRGIGVEHCALFDCFMQPSFTEGLSMALLEAAACRVPLVAASTNGEHDVIINGSTGFVCEPGDLKGLASIVGAMIEQPALRARVATGAYTIVRERYAVEHMVAEYKKLFDRLCDGFCMQ